jgi:uncharacterized protein YbaR (Trm112 family)
MDQYLVEVLQCPACAGELRWKVRESRDGHLIEADAHCLACGAVYPVRDRIGAFLTPDLAREDLWEQVESGLSRYLRQHPEIERRLLQGDEADLNAADLLFRAMVLEERGELEQAERIAHEANFRLYTAEYSRCLESQIEWVVKCLANSDGPIIDLASGRGRLVEAMVSELDAPIVASDFSPTVLRRNQRRLRFLGLEQRVSLVAFDARRTPFKTGSVTTMTTNLGLPNIEDSGLLLAELRRIVSGRLLAVTHFYPPDDEPNGVAIRHAGMSDLLFHDRALSQFAAAGWELSIRNACHGIARPTDHSRLLDGAGVDAIPVAETVLEWCVLEAH